MYKDRTGSREAQSSNLNINPRKIGSREMNVIGPKLVFSEPQRSLATFLITGIDIGAIE